MKKNEYLKKSKMFLKMAECDFAVINLIRVIKCILTAAFFINTAAFAAALFCGMKKAKK